MIAIYVVVKYITHIVTIASAIDVYIHCPRALKTSCKLGSSLLVFRKHCISRLKSSRALEKVHLKYNFPHLLGNSLYCLWHKPPLHNSHGISHHDFPKLSAISTLLFYLTTLCFSAQTGSLRGTVNWRPVYKGQCPDSLRDMVDNRGFRLQAINH